MEHIPLSDLWESSEKTAHTLDGPIPTLSTEEVHALSPISDGPLICAGHGCILLHSSSEELAGMNQLWVSPTCSRLYSQDPFSSLQCHGDNGKSLKTTANNTLPFCEGPKVNISQTRPHPGQYGSMTEGKKLRKPILKLDIIWPVSGGFAVSQLVVMQTYSEENKPPCGGHQSHKLLPHYTFYPSWKWK